MMEQVLVGQEIARICFDFAVMLQLETGAELMLETDFDLTQANTEDRLHISPGDTSATAEALAPLVHQQIVSVGIEESGVLSVVFSEGTSLTCPPNDRFEAWSITTMTGERVVALQGGSVSRWT
jgi:hypothetical protein